MSQIQPIYPPDYLALVFPQPCQILSSAVLNGGLSQVRSLLNLRVDKHAPPPWPPAKQTLSEAAALLQLPGPIAGMMTAASMQSLGESQASWQGIDVRCWITAGLSNLRRAGDQADLAPRAGTINIALHINQPLTPAAMAEALILLTEAKVTAIHDAGLLSPVSDLPASGTGTDSHAVLCPPGPEALPFCGKHTLAGELIGRAVLEACRISIGNCVRAAELND